MLKFGGSCPYMLATSQTTTVLRYNDKRLVSHATLVLNVAT